MFSRETLRRLWPRAPQPLVDGIYEAANSGAFEKYGCGDLLAVAHAMAQFSHECGAGTEMVENIHYTAARACQVWPNRYRSAADCYRKVGSWPGDPQFRFKLMDLTYGGRNGNAPFPSHDGSTYIGRGLPQTTGRGNYAKLGEKVGLDLVGHPDLVCAPEHALACGIADFVLCGCLPHALRDDVRMVTRRLNGGTVGLAERERWLVKWKAALDADAVAPGTVSVPLPRPRPAGVIQQGDEGFEVRALQEQLADKGYAVGADDGQFHEATRDAVLSLQANEGLPTTGVVDEATKQALKTAADKPVSPGREAATLDDLRATGSRTVQAADKLDFWGRATKWLGALGVGAGGAAQTGLLPTSLDDVQAKVEQGRHAYTVLQSIREAVVPVASDPLVLAVGAAALVVGLLVIRHARDIKAARLDDHRSGANMGR